jgi:hypothetical protein
MFLAPPLPDNYRLLLQITREGGGEAGSDDEEVEKTVRPPPRSVSYQQPKLTARAIVPTSTASQETPAPPVERRQSVHHLSMR